MISTAGIGSLPYKSIDSALGCAFVTDWPTLPQLPQRIAHEFMIAQALEGLPGMIPQQDGTVTIDLEIWRSGYEAFESKLDKCLKGASSSNDFLPSKENMICWEPFFWELRERKAVRAKIQIAGPLTCQWVPTTSDGSRISEVPQLATQIFKLITVRSLAMLRAIKVIGSQLLLFIDEPALYALNRTNSNHQYALSELKLLIAALRKEGALVGIHCCSNTDWKEVLELGQNIISFDTSLSGSSLLGVGEGLLRFIRNGGILAPGIVPTDLQSQRRSPADLINNFQRLLSEKLNSSPDVRDLILKHSILTPACGLALKSFGEVESIMDQLKECAVKLKEAAQLYESN